MTRTILPLLASMLALVPTIAVADDQPAEAVLRTLIAEQPEISSRFAAASVGPVPGMRGAVGAIDDGRQRRAIILMRAADWKEGPQVGRLQCYATLLRIMTPDRLSPLLAQTEGDTLVAEALAREAPVEGDLGKVEEGELSIGNRNWRAYTCQAAVANIVQQPLAPASPERVARITYDIAKRNHQAGEIDAAIMRFRRLRTDPTLYPNVVLFLVDLLEDSHPDIAEGLRRSTVDLSRATDPAALVAFSNACQRAKQPELASQAADRLRQLRAVPVANPAPSAPDPPHGQKF